jgi:hypothetical protein
MNNTNYFIHFGCWNNGGCPQDNDLTKVLQNIDSLKDKPKFLTICGDNYYPKVIKSEIEGQIKEGKKKKEDKKKYFINDDLISGFNCLPKDVNIYMTYGNHDYETELYVSDNEKENNCMVTQNEISVTNNYPNIKLKLFQSVAFNSNTMILFIDTTIYDDDNINEYINCYKYVDEKYTLIDSVKNDQLNFINSFVTSIKSNNNINNIIIIGHHPLAEFKIKKETMNLFTLSSELNDILYNNIYNELKLRDINYYYLCADLHQYQSGNIIINNDMKIKQYIVGTAGAKKDPIDQNSLFTTPQTKENIQYFMDEDDRILNTNKNGYLKCNTDGNNLNFNFITLDNVGGKRKIKKITRKMRKIRKTRKSKRKRSKRKINY